MAEQLVFNLPARPALGRADFFVSPMNEPAVQTIEGWHDWPLGKLVLWGPEASGKTHLAHVWADLSGAEIVSAVDLVERDIHEIGGFVGVEDVDHIAGNPAAEEALFHLHNLVQEAGGALLLTSRIAPARWNLHLPDLQSRIAQAVVARLQPPDDALLAAVLVKQATDLRLAIPPDLVQFVVPRMERSFAAARDLVLELDQRALREKRRPSRALAAAILAEWNE
jgi:chromosomal replication initiation ATPase DnaA